MKKIISLLLVAFMLLAVAGCGANDSATGTSSKVSSEDIYTDASSDPSVTSEDVLDDTDVTASVSSKTSSKVNSTTSKTSSLKPTTSKTSSARPLTPNKIRRTLVTQARYKYFKQVGRCDVGKADGLYLSWAGATVEFDLLCKDTISLSFSKSGSSNDCFIEVYVDGVLAEERTRITKTGTYQVATGLSEGVHRVKIVRETDAGQGASILFTAIETYGNLVEKAPEDKELYIEAIGNANLIGWGVRLEDSFFKNYKPADKVDGVTKQEIARSFENMDSTLSYGSVAAKKLNADYYAIARQGAGIAATYHKSGDTCNGTASGGLLPALYENVALGNSKKYEPKRTPDVIVIDAGETDINKSLLDCVMYNGKKGIDKATAKQIAKDFLLTLKQKNPGVKIIWCVGLTADSTEFKSHVKDIISMAGGEAAGIYYLELKKTTRSGYPSKAEHEAAGTLLANKIKAIIKK